MYEEVNRISFSIDLCVEFKDLGGTLRRTSKTTLRSYDSRASGDQKCPQRQGAWQIWRIEIKLQYSSRIDL